MVDSTNLLFSLAILMLSARVLEEIAERIGQPALMGDVIAGILLGPAVAGVLSPTNGVLEFFGTLGVVFLLLLAGLEVGIRKIEKVSTEAAIISIVCAVLAILLGYCVGRYVLGYGPVLAGLMGIALSTTASAIGVEVLEERGMLFSRVGRILVSAGVFDDIIALGAITMFFSAITASGEAPVVIIGLVSKIFFFFAGSYLFGYYLIPRILRMAKKMKSPEAPFGVSLLLVLAYAAMAEYMGLHAVIGAFVAGLALNKYMNEKEKWWFEKDIKSLAEGFFAPIFFVLVGASLSLEGLVEAPVVVLIVLAAAFISKFSGGYLVTRMMGGGHHESLAVGSGMAVRGSVALVVVHMAQKYMSSLPGIGEGVAHIATIIVTVVLLVNLIAIPMLEWSLSKIREHKRNRMLEKVFPRMRKK